jgi:hypothetical protein
MAMTTSSSMSVNPRERIFDFRPAVLAHRRGRFPISDWEAGADGRRETMWLLAFTKLLFPTQDVVFVEAFIGRRTARSIINFSIRPSGPNHDFAVEKKMVAVAIHIRGIGQTM